MTNNALAYIGVSIRNEVCLWLGVSLFLCIFDGSIFMINSDLTAVWNVKMPEVLPVLVQNSARAIMTFVVLARDLTLHLYLASFVVLLYPFFTDDRPGLMLPWLILCATRRLLCELISLTLGLILCLLMGPTTKPCMTFLGFKLAYLGHAFYQFFVVEEYYRNLLIAQAIGTNPEHHDYVFEQAVRRRKTKSMLSEQTLRTVLYDFYSKRVYNVENATGKTIVEAQLVHPSTLSLKSMILSTSNRFRFCSGTPDSLGQVGTIAPRRATDCILDQFVDLGYKIVLHLNEGQSIYSGSLDVRDSVYRSEDMLNFRNDPQNEPAPPPYVGNSGVSNKSNYQTEYPDIFMKSSSILSNSEQQNEIGVCDELKKRIQASPQFCRKKCGPKELVKKKLEFGPCKGCQCLCPKVNSSEKAQSTSEKKGLCEHCQNTCRKKCQPKKKNKKS